MTRTKLSRDEAKRFWPTKDYVPRVRLNKTATKHARKKVEITGPPTVIEELTKEVTVKSLHKVGRPSEYKPQYAKQAKVACERGFTDQELAELFDVSTVTIYNWTLKYPEFLNALKIGKSVWDNRTERSLYHKANGYTYDSEKIFYDSDTKEVIRVPIKVHHPPDTTAIIYWLGNRRRDIWKNVNRTEVTGADGGPVKMIKEGCTLQEAVELYQQSLANTYRPPKQIEGKVNDE